MLPSSFPSPPDGLTAGTSARACAGDGNQESCSGDSCSLLSHIMSLNAWVKAAEKEKPLAGMEQHVPSLLTSCSHAVDRNTWFSSKNELEITSLQNAAAPSYT